MSIVFIGLLVVLAADVNVTLKIKLINVKTKAKAKGLLLGLRGKRCTNNNTDSAGHWE